MTDHESPLASSGSGRFDVEGLRRALTKMHLIGVAGFIDRLVRRLLIFGVTFLRKRARLPVVGRAIDPLLARLDQGDRLHFDSAELVRVCSVLDAQQITYWVTGGWGLDVLAGCETRRHGDLDLALDAFSKNLPQVAAVLTRLGYQRRRPLTGTVWFPDTEIYEDAQGHHIEVLSISFDLLRKAQDLLSPTATSESAMHADPDEVTPWLRERCTAVGTILGAAIPTLSLTAQQLFHLGYKDLRPEDSHADDLFRFLERGDAWIDASGDDAARASTRHHTVSTLLLVPVFTFPPDLWRLCRIYHNELNLMPPHVTLAYPFLPLSSVTHEVVRRLEVLFSHVSAFDFELNQVRWFGTDVVYLEPSRSDVFVSIVEAIKDEFPDFHPYDDAYESVIPHVCLSEHGTLADRRILGRQAPKFLPISSRAAQVWLMTNERRADEWSIARIFPLAECEGGATSVLP
jgi:lincosamide nucleotidyltransferase A/C/D/E